MPGARRRALELLTADGPLPAAWHCLGDSRSDYDMADHLHLPSTMQGLAIGIQPFVEFPLIPVAVVGARRFGAMRLIGLATVLAMFANLWFACADTAVDILIAQSLMGVVWGVFAALGIIVAQRLLRTAVATASGIFMSA